MQAAFAGLQKSEHLSATFVPARRRLSAGRFTGRSSDMRIDGRRMIVWDRIDANRRVARYGNIKT
jgi:hypothetical protein